MAPLTGQYILVIGGSSGIGFSVAKLALAGGAKVAIASSSADKVNNAVSRLDGKASGHTVDLSAVDPEAAIEKLLADVTVSGKLDHIINTAGRGLPKPIAKLDLASANELARLPLFVPLFLGKLGPKYLKEGYNSSIILTSGQIAEKPAPGYSVLSAFVSSQHALARNLAVDLAPRRVNVVAPGPTETEMWGASAEFLRGFVSKQNLLGKPGQPDEVAEAYIYLMKNTDATGSVVSTNGGIILK
ncbi:short chain dehydrogenase/reductase family [Seiridium cupressi]